MTGINQEERPVKDDHEAVAPTIKTTEVAVGIKMREVTR